MEKVRIDKWLWAARFFKTRSLAKHAIEGGKVHCAGQKVKASKEITVNTRLSIRQGLDIKEVDVIALADQRRGASEAVLLYQETPASLQQRETNSLQRKNMNVGIQTQGRPSKKQRRQIHRLRELFGD